MAERKVSHVSPSCTCFIWFKPSSRGTSCCSDHLSPDAGSDARNQPGGYSFLLSEPEKGCQQPGIIVAAVDKTSGSRNVKRLDKDAACYLQQRSVTQPTSCKVVANGAPSETELTAGKDDSGTGFPSQVARIQFPVLAHHASSSGDRLQTSIVNRTSKH